jgi:hypothetical protein
MPATYDAERFVLTLLWSNDPALAARADAAGIDRIGLDLEVLGKAERQKCLGSWVSPHRPEDLRAMREVVRRGELFCRINPIHDGSAAEIERVLGHGVEVLMLPMFTSVGEVETFVALVAGRAKAALLLEHGARRNASRTSASGTRLRSCRADRLALSPCGEPVRLLACAAERIAGRSTDGLRLCVGGMAALMIPSPPDRPHLPIPRLGRRGARQPGVFGRAERFDVAPVRRVAREWHWQACSKDELDGASAPVECVDGSGVL